MSRKSLFFCYFSRYVNVCNICKRETVLQTVTKLYTFSVACALPSQVRRRRLDTLERENRTSVKSLKWDIQDILLGAEYREQTARFTHHVQRVSAPTPPAVTAHPVPKATKPPTPDKTTWKV